MQAPLHRVSLIGHEQVEPEQIWPVPPHAAHWFWLLQMRLVPQDAPLATQVVVAASLVALMSRVDALERLVDGHVVGDPHLHAPEEGVWLGEDFTI